MLPGRLRQLLEIIPARVKLYEQTRDARHIDPFFRPEILQAAQAQMDPSFGWQLAVAYAIAKEPLPAIVSEPAIREAYQYASGGNCSDIFIEVLVLREEPMKIKRGVLEALLLVSPALPMEKVAELTGLSVKAVMLYEELFFAVRQRSGDLCFLASILYPDTRRVEFEPGYLSKVDPCDLLKRAAWRGGVDVVMELLGRVTSGHQITDQEYARVLKTNILSEAAWLAQVGLIHQPLEIFKLASKLMVAAMKASGRAQGGHWRVATAPGATDAAKSGWSVLEAARAPLTEARTRLTKVPLARKWLKSSHRSHTSHASREGEAAVASFERPTAIEVRAPNRMRAAYAIPLPESDGDSLLKDLPGTASRTACIDECLVGVV